MKKLSKKTLQTIEDGQEQVENDEGRTLKQVREELDSFNYRF
ncbi:MAG: hypothetical protein ACOC53_06755 [Candidatus Saliniplasma sp.]